MQIDPERCWRALKARDGRFDGRFYVGVASTGIYCRPVCATRPAKREHCSFYPSAAAAEAAGFRPCLRCRPELAPGNAAIDAPARLARAAAGLIEEGCMNGAGVGAVAARLGVTDRHLRRIFEAQFGVAPVEFVQTQRLLLAKRLLTDTALPVTEVALASGFGSVRRFNALFRNRYRMAPSRLRHTTADRHSEPLLRFALGYRAPFDWDAHLEFLGARAIEGVEQVADGAYLRTLRIERGADEIAGWVAARHAPRRRALEVTVSASLARAIPAVLARIKHLFDLACVPSAVSDALGALAARHPGLRLPGAVDGFELAARAILGQQVTVRAARTLAGRFAAAFGAPIETPHAALRTLFPPAARIATLTPARIARLGVVGHRARAIVGLARAIANGDLDLFPGADAEATIARLRALPGVGDWTAQYIAMRALGWPDAFPHTDHGVLEALGESNPRRALAQAEAWRPWRAYAVMHLWKSLEASKT
jgi:AraC family transcriptional regulator of adaptative response / DNA-3-methyladenine glycosylase II